MTDETTPAEDNIEPFPTEGADDELEQLRAENQTLKDQALRYAAEAENTRRRAEREANDARAYAIQKLARDLLGAADNLARAMAAAPGDGAEPTAVKNFVVGVEMTEKELQSAFERNGLKKVDPKRGEKFDPHLHQAMMEQPADDVPGGTVLQVMQAGYELFGRIVRPAMVIVAAKGSGQAAQANGADPYAAGEEAAGGNVDTRA
ncbi:MAG: nucleotide exchange factor GrpE [Phenylobacterium sp.]